MATLSSIEWTDATWNPVTGCTKISQGCKFCYAERMANRLKLMGMERYANGFELTLQRDVLEVPLRWRTPRTIFVNSMSDLFHKDIPDSYVTEVFEVMKKATWHTFQVLTKRSDRLSKLAPCLPWATNIWQGVSVESSDHYQRARDLAGVRDASVRFLSVEPLISAVPELPLEGIDWVIVGGESGPGAREMRPEWAREVRDLCLERKIPFFFKQWGGVQKKRNGRELDKTYWDQMPVPRGGAMAAK